LTPIGVIVFGLFTVVFVLLAIFVDKRLGLPGLLSGSIRFYVSFPVIVTGVTIAAWSAFHFLKVKGTPVPFNPPPALVNSGPYRYVRNPMLTGVFIFLFGIGVLINSVSLVVFFLPMFIFINIWELKAIEEPELCKRLGDAYIAYRKQTPMFIPGRKRVR
jgi:protein-S-isoprenylcysteine O-methyltransferase Ste14